MNEILERCKTTLRNHYGSRFKGLMLYGSKARAEDDSSSDIDLLVLLEKPFDYFLELRRMTELLYPLQLESEQMISVKPAAVDEYQAGVLQLYRNAMNEGVTL